MKYEVPDQAGTAKNDISKGCPSQGIQAEPGPSHSLNLSGARMSLGGNDSVSERVPVHDLFTLLMLGTRFFEK